MFKGSPDGKSLIELSLKQIEQKVAYERERAAVRRKPMIIERPPTPRPQDLADHMKKMKLNVE